MAKTPKIEFTRTIKDSFGDRSFIVLVDGEIFFDVTKGTGDQWYTYGPDPQEPKVNKLVEKYGLEGDWDVDFGTTITEAKRVIKRAIRRRMAERIQAP